MRAGLQMKLNTFCAVLKQLNTSRLDDHSRKLLDDCFPEFTGSQKVADWLKKSGITLQVTSKGTIPSTSGRMRRYAGDSSLPGGRYFAVCHDTSGDDGGTMVWELMSYWGARSRLVPELVDSTVHTQPAEALRREVDWLGDSPFVLVKASEIKSIPAEGVVLGETIGKVLPLDIREVQIPNVLDLRLREAQDWFAIHFGTLESDGGNSGVQVGETKLYMQKTKPEDFKSLLPTLLAPNPGGLAFHGAVGAWLRTHGVNGLVFPSSRRNCRVSSTNTAVLEFDGWNFVDYRDSGSAAFEGFFGLLPHWLEQHQTGVEVSDWSDDGLKRSWRVAGPEEGERRRYDLEWRTISKGSQPSVIQDNRYGGRET